MSQIDKLVEGYHRFWHSYYQEDRALFERLTRQGQSPKTLVIGCCDSRVDPAIVTDCEPGDLFIVRNVANLVPPLETAGHFHGTSAALEFGVRHLEVENIIVLGHAQCGGINALMSKQPDSTAGESFIDSWMAVATNARNRVLSRMHDAPAEAQQRACEQEAILVSLDNLLSFPWILERVGQGTLTLHGWYFDLERGELQRFNPESHAFEPFPV
jgi:carbonic anhydrase